MLVCPLTAGGAELLATARHIGESVTELERRLLGRDLRLEGSLRVTTTDTLMVSVLRPFLTAFRARHPGITIKMATSNAFADLTRRDADVSLRPTATPPETFVGRRVSGVAFALYGLPPPPRVQSSGGAASEDLADRSWISLGDALANSSVARWMRASLPQAEIALRCDSLIAAAPVPRQGSGSRHFLAT